MLRTRLGGAGQGAAPSADDVQSAPAYRSAPTCRDDARATEAGFKDRRGRLGPPPPQLAADARRNQLSPGELQVAAIEVPGSAFRSIWPLVTGGGPIRRQPSSPRLHKEIEVSIAEAKSVAQNQTGATKGGAGR